MNFTHKVTGDTPYDNSRVSKPPDQDPGQPEVGYPDQPDRDAALLPVHRPGGLFRVVSPCIGDRPGAGGRVRLSAGGRGEPPEGGAVLRQPGWWGSPGQGKTGPEIHVGRTSRFPGPERASPGAGQPALSDLHQHSLSRLLLPGTAGPTQGAKTGGVPVVSRFR